MDNWLGILPDFSALTGDQKRMFGTNDNEPVYSRATVLPLAMAFDEDWSDTWNHYRWGMGMCERRRGSFYSRKFIDICQDEAKYIADVDHIIDVPRHVRKQSQKAVGLAIRGLYHMAKGTHDPVKGTNHPLLVAA